MTWSDWPVLAVAALHLPVCLYAAVCLSRAYDRLCDWALPL